MLWRLLDPSGAAATWMGADAVGRTAPVAGPGLRTTVSVDGVQVQLLDGLVHRGGACVLARFVRAVDRSCDVEHRLRLGGFDQATITWTGPPAAIGSVADDDRPQPTTTDGAYHDEPLTGSVEDRVVVLGGTGRSRLVDGAIRTIVHATPGQWNGLLIAVADEVGRAVPALPAAEEVAAALEAAITSAAEFETTCALPDHHPELGIRALEVVTACTAAKSGAVVASPTTSLPEVVGGNRQFDYRYCWLRDSAQAVSIAAVLGKSEAAEGLLGFMRQQGPDRMLESPLFNVRGGGIPDERTIGGVAGWGGSRPVRVGNDAAGQIQHDVLGIVVEAMSTYADVGNRLRRGDWRIVATFADRAVIEPGPSNGIWELRESADLVSADIGRWLALDRALRLAGAHRRRWLLRRFRWSRARRTVRAKLLAAAGADGVVPQAYGDDHRDASALLMVIYGVVDGDDPLATAIVDDTLATLGTGPFLRRYDGEKDDGFSSGEGAFVPCSWWAVSALAMIGRLEEATDRAAAMVEVLDGLQPEEVDPATGEALGNIPLVWSHTEAARAAVLLDRAARLARS